MRYASLLSLAALALASDVHELHKDDFKAFVDKHDLSLVEFYAPWCGHCQALAPKYEEAATKLKEKKIPLAKVDCTAEADLCKEHGVEGYPALKVFRGEQNIKPYVGQREAQAIVSYMTKQALPAVSLLTSSSALDEFKTADKIVLIGFFAADDKSSNATFSEVADEKREHYLFGATYDAALAKAEGVKQPAIVLYKTFDEGKNQFTDAFDLAAIIEFAKTSSIPLIGEISPETYAEYMDAGIPLAYIFSETAEEREQLSSDLKSVAKQYKGKLNFATIDAAAFGQHAGNLNLEVGKWPAFAIQDSAKKHKYPYAEAGDKSALDEKKISQFVADFVAGKIEPSIKSEPIPENQDGPVTVVVAKNYQDVVIDNDKDVLLEFYAPWCGHCKALAPEYDQLGNMFKKFSDKVVIAKVDATANDVPDEIDGFPTIKLFKAGSKTEPLSYSGSRTAEDLAKFVRDSGTHQVEAEKLAADEGVDTESMPKQAAAATEKILDKVKEAAAGAIKAAVDDDDSEDSHDEL